MYFMSLNVPRLSWHSSMIAPTNSWGVITWASTIGSSIQSISCTGGRFVGLSMNTVSPSVFTTLYTTLGAVVTRSRSNSRSSRCWMISMCRRPRNPQRKP